MTLENLQFEMVPISGGDERYRVHCIEEYTDFDLLFFILISECVGVNKAVHLCVEHVTLLTVSHQTRLWLENKSPTSRNKSIVKIEKTMRRVVKGRKTLSDTTNCYMVPVALVLGIILVADVLLIPAV